MYIHIFIEFWMSSGIRNCVGGVVEHLTGERGSRVRIHDRLAFYKKQQVTPIKLEFILGIEKCVQFALVSPRRSGDG